MIVNCLQSLLNDALINDDHVIYGLLLTTFIHRQMIWQVLIGVIARCGTHLVQTQFSGDIDQWSLDTNAMKDIMVIQLELLVMIDLGHYEPVTTSVTEVRRIPVVSVPAMWCWFAV